MAKFAVTVDGQRYGVEAPDEQTAWDWANQTHRDAMSKLEEAGRAAGGQYKIGKEGFQQAAEDVAGKTGVVGRGLQGVGETFDRYAYGLKGLVTDLSPEDRQRLEQNKIMTEAGGVPATVGQVAGDLAITGPAMGAGGAAAPVVGRALPMAMRAMRSLPGRVVSALAPGAALGAVSSPEDRAEGAAYGAAGGAAGAGITRALGGVLKPFVSSEAKELMAQGIQPTPGQAVGGGLGKFEEKLGSLPLVGDLIGSARNRAIQEYNQALAGRVAQEVTGEGGAARTAGKALGEVGDESLLKLRGQIGQVYESVLEQMPKLRIEREPIERKLTEITSDAGLDLSEASGKRLMAYAEKNLLARGADISGETAKRIESDLGKAASRARTSSTGEERAYGEALDRLHQAWREGMMGSMPPEAQALLQRANAAWRGLMPLDQAAAMAPSQARGGVYTPRVLRQALAKADTSQADNVLRTLQAQPVAQATNPYEYAASMSRAGRTLGDVVPDSGTAARLGAGGLALGGGGLAAGAGAIEPVTALTAAAAGTGATWLAYSRLGSQLLTQGAFPATRDAIGNWLAKQGVPRNVIPALAEQTLAAYARTKPGVAATLTDAERERQARLRAALVGAAR